MLPLSRFCCSAFRGQIRTYLPPSLDDTIQFETVEQAAHNSDFLHILHGDLWPVT
jgi:hypothetical protein